MYKCTECGCMTKNKPAFCECGNDEFIFLEEPKSKIFSESSGGYFSNLSEKIGKNLPSIIIFAICMILSVLSLVFLEIPQSEDTPTAKNISSEKKSLKQPEDIWVQTKKNEITVKTENPPAELKQDKKVLPVQIKKDSSGKQSDLRKAVVPKKASVGTKNTVAPAAPVKQTPKNGSSGINAVQSKKNGSGTKISSGSVQNTPQTQSSVSIKTPSTSAPSVQQPSVPAVDYAALNAYKISLRDVISSQTDFKSVSGDGSCEVTFSVNSSGYPINKIFTVKSSNPLLNKVVAAAFNNLKTVPAPPEFYSGEKFTLRVYLKDGRYSVSLI